MHNSSSSDRADGNALSAAAEAEAEDGAAGSKRQSSDRLARSTARSGWSGSSSIDCRCASTTLYSRAIDFNVSLPGTNGKGGSAAGHGPVAASPGEKKLFRKELFNSRSSRGSESACSPFPAAPSSGSASASSIASTSTSTLISCSRKNSMSAAPTAFSDGVGAWLSTEGCGNSEKEEEEELEEEDQAVLPPEAMPLLLGLAPERGRGDTDEDTSR